jgi:hypothetical protein
MKITFELDDRMVPSIEEYMKTQGRYEQDELTKTQRLKFPYKTVEELLQDSLHQVVHQIALQFPPDHIREHLAKVKEFQDKFKEAAKPVVVTA